MLRDTWGYDGFVVSDWGAVHDPVKAFRAGLDLQMPENESLKEQLTTGLENGEITMEEIDTAVRRMIKFLFTEVKKDIAYDRDEQHNLVREVATKGIVLLKNEDNTFPLTKEKYKRIAVIGEFATSPLIGGQGSAEVKVKKEYIDSPLEEIKKYVGDDIEFKYWELYQKTSFSAEMLWTEDENFIEFVSDCF